MKLARKRKKNVSQKLADEFFNKHSKWRSNKSSNDLDALHSTSRIETTQSSSYRPQTQSEPSFRQGNTTVINQQNSQRQQPIYNLESGSQFKNANESTSPELKPSNLFSRRDSEAPQEAGTFGLDEISSTQQTKPEIKDRPILFDQLSNALEKSDSISSSGHNDSLRSAISPENMSNQQATVPSNQQDTEIDQLSNRIGSLLQEVKSIKADKELKIQQDLDKESSETISSTDLHDIEKSDISLRQKDSELLEESKSRVNIQGQITNRISDIDSKKQELNESDQKIQFHSPNLNSTTDSSLDSISVEEETDSSISMLRAKINEVMNISGKLDQDNEEYFESKSMKEESPKIKEPSLPTFKPETANSFSNEQIPIIKARTQSKTPINKEKLDNVLGLLKEDEKSPLEKEEVSAVEEPEIVPPISEIKVVKIKISRKYFLDPFDESLNIELKYENKLDIDYEKAFITSHVSPEGWKIDQPEIDYQKDKKTEIKKVKLLLKSPILEWRLTAGKFEQ